MIKYATDMFIKCVSKSQNLVALVQVSKHSLSLNCDRVLCNLWHIPYSILEGGADSGFHVVKPTEYKPRLLHFSGQKQQIYVIEVSYRPHSFLQENILQFGLCAK